MAATIKDISRETGLSLATISKYLNGGNVLPKNKVKIEAAIEKLHYQVNEVARGLVTNRTMVVGIIVYEIDSIFVGDLLKTIGAELRKAGYAMIICDSQNSPEREESNMRFLVSKKVDGIILMPCLYEAECLETARTAEIPVVVIDRLVRDQSFDSVSCDNYGAAKGATRYLIERHHTKIALIGSDKVYTGLERKRGYLDALKEAGVPVREDYMYCSEFSTNYAYLSMKKLLAMEDRPTAVFLTNYAMNVGAVIAFNESGLYWPGDVSLVGFDDLLFPDVVRPKLSVVVQPMEELACKAVEVLLGRLRKELTGGAVHLLLPTEFREGESVRDLRIG